MPTMASKKTRAITTNKRWMIYVILIAFASWAGLWGITYLPINGTSKSVFFVLLFSAITSTMMPVVSYLNARFGKFSNVRTYGVRFVRQSIWIGLFLAVTAWLQMQRALNATLALILMAVLVLIETFMITREAPSEEL